MKNSSLIIKIAVIVSAVASVFSIVTLIRAVIVKANVVMPIIQVVGSVAIFAICFVMLRILSTARVEDESDAEDEETDDEETDDEEADEKENRKTGRRVRKARDTEQQKEEESDKAKDEEAENDKTQDEVEELFEKYHLSDFEE